MIKKYEAEIKELELRARLNAQQNSQFTLRAEKLKLQRRIEDIEKTDATLEEAIAETKRQLGEG